MSNTNRRIAMLFAALVVLAAFAFAYSRTHRSKQPQLHFVETTTHSPTTLDQPQDSASMRNLALQPEALKFSRRLGHRFNGRNETSVIIGTITTDAGRQPVQIIRRQTERGERVEIAVAGAERALSWDESEGAKSREARATGYERELIERLALDSADQFVLAQLRGASYYTVARNVRPAEAGEADGYNGPLWDIVRIDDPETDAAKAPQSKWRLYYINSTTGLIDKTVTDLRGEKIETTFARWIAQDGEKFPSLITWKRQGQVIMEFTVTSFSHSQS